MPPAPYPDFRWFFRSLRALPIVAIAALVGGIIGGFSVFAVDLALTAPPSHDGGAEVGKINREKASDHAGAVAAAGTSAPAAPEQAAANKAADAAPSSVAPPQPEPQSQPSQSQPPQSQIAVMPPGPTPQSQPRASPQIAVTPPLPPRQTTWPDALSRERKSTPDTAPSVAPPPPPQQAAATTQPPATASQPATRSEFATRKPIPAKRQVAVKRNTERPAADRAEVLTRTGRPVYDSYGHADETGPLDARARYQYSNRRYDSRREQAEDDDDRSGDGHADGGRGEQSGRSGDAMPPQPAPPPLLFGLFGGGDRYDER